MTGALEADPEHRASLSRAEKAFTGVAGSDPCALRCGKNCPVQLQVATTGQPYGRMLIDEIRFAFRHGSEIQAVPRVLRALD